MAGDNAEYVREVLSLFEQADLHDGLLWRVSGDQVRFTAVCSDFFAWGIADGEPIEPSDLNLLSDCLVDLNDPDVDASYMLPELFAARKRKMRPMRLILGAPYVDDPKSRGIGPGPLQDLFLACGPERDPRSEG